jgi:type IV pilus assembly protein PilN
MGAMVDSQEGRNNLLRSEIKVLDKQNEQINSLEAQKQQFIARMVIIEKLQRSRPEIIHVFDTFVKTIPDGTYLTSLKQNDEKFEIKGVAQSSTRVSSFMRALSASEWLKDPELDVVENKKGGTAGSDFTLFARQVTTAVEQPAATGKKKAPARRTK